MTDFNYKKYSLEKLEEWMHDAMSSAEATPQEIYDVIKGVVQENYYHYKHHASQAYELLALLNGNGKDHITFNIDPPGNQIDFLSVGAGNTGYSYTSCDIDNTSDYCNNSWNSFWEEEEVKDDGMRPWGHSDLEYSIANKDKVVKWVLPIEEVEDGDTGEQGYFITFPDDLLEATNFKPGDEIEWVDMNDGTFILRKPNVI